MNREALKMYVAQRWRIAAVAAVRAVVSRSRYDPHYQNRRPEYISAFFNVIDWDKVNAHYKAAVG